VLGTSRLARGFQQRPQYPVECRLYRREPDMQCPFVVGGTNLEARLGTVVAIEHERAMIAGTPTTA
jgi:hypothetical protein